MQRVTSSAPRLAIAASVIGLLAMTGTAGASHPRPKSAKPVTTSLVPSYDQCLAPSSTHGPPLAFPSCNPPGQSSSAVTVGTADANGAPANSVGAFRLSLDQSESCVPGPPDDCDLRVVVSLSDIRCQAGTSACGPANAADGADYTGELRADATYRLTDHFNAVAPGGGPDAATLTDFSFPVNMPCVATASTSIGGACSVNTTWNTLVPGVAKDGKRGVLELGQVQVTDGGPDGAVATTPNARFAAEGIFIP
jgi:hypothetical protein